MLNTFETSTFPAQNDVSAKFSGKLSEIITACAADKQPVILSNLPDEGNQLVAEAIHDLSSWADRSFFVLSCHSQSGRQSKAGITLSFPVHYELSDLFSNISILEPLKGGTVLLNDPFVLSQQQQQQLVELLSVELELKVIINGKAIDRDQQSLDVSSLRDIRLMKVPSLRNHSTDIRFAANYFLSKSNLEWNKNIPGISEECLQQMLTYPWPGQLPQLRETIRQAAFISPANELLGLSSLPVQIRTFKATDRDFLKEAVKQAEYEMIYKTLRETNNNKRKTAEILKISRKTLYSKINMYKMNNFSAALGL
jgi:two-component system, NtrC family, response regulator HydG